MNEYLRALDPLSKALVSECESYKEANAALLEEREELMETIQQLRDEVKQPCQHCGKHRAPVHIGTALKEQGQ